MEIKECKAAKLQIILNTPQPKCFVVQILPKFRMVANQRDCIVQHCNFIINIVSVSPHHVTVTWILKTVYVHWNIFDG